MYGKNGPSHKKRLVGDGLKQGKDFIQLAGELNVNTATAEVYGIDCLAAGQDLNHQSMAEHLGVTDESFDMIRREIITIEDKKLRTVRDNLDDSYTYNQIRFVLACLIHELEL
ncbi:hypothetical protein OS493_009065 [Desmophyllum pertusum]|nr:hypothetical protein OS493_009065 [Desmophyllum pertusum]